MSGFLRLDKQSVRWFTSEIMLSLHRAIVLTIWRDRERGRGRGREGEGGGEREGEGGREGERGRGREREGGGDRGREREREGGRGREREHFRNGWPYIVYHTSLQLLTLGAHAQRGLL